MFSLQSECSSCQEGHAELQMLKLCFQEFLFFNCELLITYVMADKMVVFLRLFWGNACSVVYN